MPRDHGKCHLSSCAFIAVSTHYQGCTPLLPALYAATVCVITCCPCHQVWYYYHAFPGGGILRPGIMRVMSIARLITLPPGHGSWSQAIILFYMVEHLTTLVVRSEASMEGTPCALIQRMRASPAVHLVNSSTLTRRRYRLVATPIKKSSSSSS